MTTEGPSPAPTEWPGVAAPGGPSELRRGLPVIVGGIAGMTMQAAGFLSLGTMMTPLVQEFGWSRTGIVAVGAFSALLAFAFAPAAGRAVDRFGPRRVALSGFAAYSLALLTAAATGPGVGSWWTAWVLITITNFFVGPMIWTSAVTRSFADRRGLALGLVLSGNGVANLVIPLYLAVVISAAGWRAGYVALAGLVLLVGGGVTWLFFRMPPPASDDARDRGLAGMTLAQVMRTSRHWRLCAVILIVSTAVGTLNLHLQAMLIDRGATLLSAAALAAVFGPAQIVGRLIGGWLLDIVPGPLFGFVVFLLPVLACGLMLGGVAGGALAFLIPACVGFAAGVELDLASYMASRYFGPRHFGTIFSVVFSFFAIGYTVGPLAAAYLRDTTGDYDMVVLAVAALMPVAAILVVTLGRYPDGEGWPRTA